MNLAETITGLSDDLSPIRELATRLAVEGYSDVPHAIAISPRTHVAPEYHALYVFEGVQPQIIRRYETRHSLDIPPVYKSVLTQIGGLNAFEFALFGIGFSMTLDPPLLDRSYVQPYELAMAENNWKHGYSVDQRFFHFGSGPLTDDEHVGYFMADFGHIHSYHKSGTLLSSWNTLTDFLVDELRRAEAESPRFERPLDDPQRSVDLSESSSIWRRILNWCR